MGAMKDSLRRLDLFRCESLRLKTHWVTVKTFRGGPVSPSFIECMIGTIRREYVDHLLFWNESDLARKLEAFKEYDNGYRIHQSLDHKTPEEGARKDPLRPATPNHFACRDIVKDYFSLHGPHD